MNGIIKIPLQQTLPETVKFFSQLDQHLRSASIGCSSQRVRNRGTNVVIMDPDVAEFFPDGDSANDALRSLIPIIKKREKRAAEQGH